MTISSPELAVPARSPLSADPLLSVLGGHLGYCLLHGWEDPGLTTSGSDTDIAITRRGLETLEAALRSRSDVRIAQLIQHEVTGFYFVLAARRDGRWCFIRLDAAVDYRVDGRVYFRNRELLAGRRTVKGVQVAAPAVEFAYLLVKKLSKGYVPAQQRTRLRRLFDMLGPDGDSVVRGLLGLRWGALAAECLRRPDGAALEDHLPSLRRVLRRRAVARNPLNPAWYWPAELRRRWRRWRSPTGFCVAVLGPDGAGKSTLIERLAQHGVATAFRRVSMFHFQAQPEGRGKPPVSVTDPHGRLPYAPWLSALKAGYYAARSLSAYLTIVRPSLVRSTLVLFDRYYDDVFVDPRRYRYGGSAAWLRLAGRLVRRPDVYLVLDVPETALRQRKAEVPLQETVRQHRAYRDLAARLPNAIVVDGSGPIDAVAESAADVVAEHLSARYIRRRRHWFRADDGEETFQWLSSILCASTEARFVRTCRGGEPGPGGGEKAREFGWWSLGDGRGYLVPWGASRAAVRSFDLYNVQSRHAAAAKAIVTAAVRRGLGRWVMPTVRLVGPTVASKQGDPETLLFDHLARIFNRQDLKFGISVGTPGPQRKPVLLALAPDGSPLAYVKVGSGPSSDALVRREGDALRFLAVRRCRSFSPPALLHAGTWGGRPFVAQSAPDPPGPGSSPARGWEWSRVPAELAGMHTRWMPLAESAFREELTSRIAAVPNRYFRNILRRALQKAESSLKDQRLPFHFSHGDFAPWNIRRCGERVHVFDWEYSREEGLPAEDVFHFLFQQTWSLQRQDIHAVYGTFLAAAGVREVVTRHLAGLGLAQPAVEPLFLLYRLNHLSRDAMDLQARDDVLAEFAAFGKVINAG